MKLETIKAYFGDSVINKANKPDDFELNTTIIKSYNYSFIRAINKNNEFLKALNSKISLTEFELIRKIAEIEDLLNKITF